jgi:cobalt-precorrin-5B (C1)-methyltransferase
MIQQHLQQLAQQQHYSGGFTVIIGVKNGVALAKKTLNARLGIIGGLSILGTTGIVRPFSCSAYIASIHRAIDVADANQIQHIAACTGSGSEQMIQAHYQLSEMALIEMGDFIGAVLKYLKKVPIAKLSIVGGFGKISKFAAGHLDLHSRKSQIDFDFLARLAIADLATEQTETQVLYRAIQNCNTSIEALQICQDQHIDLAARICKQALLIAKKYVPEGIEVEVLAINRRNELVGLATAEMQT